MENPYQTNITVPSRLFSILICLNRLVWCTSRVLLHIVLMICGYSTSISLLPPPKKRLSPSTTKNTWKDSKAEAADNSCFTFLMKKPWKMTSREVQCAVLGTTLITLCTSWMTALEYGRLFLSATRTWRLPTTLLNSSWTWSLRCRMRNSWWVCHTTTESWLETVIAYENPRGAWEDDTAPEPALWASFGGLVDGVWV